MDHSRLHSHGLGFEKGQVPLVMSFTTTALERTSALDIETSSSAQSTGKHKSPEEGQTTADSAMFARELGLGGTLTDISLTLLAFGTLPTETHGGFSGSDLDLNS